MGTRQTSRVIWGPNTISDETEKAIRKTYLVCVKTPDNQSCFLVKQ